MSLIHFKFLIKGLWKILKVTSVEVPLFVTFHFINAYEEEDEDGRVTAIIADCCEHNANTAILDQLRLQNLRSFNGQDMLPDARYRIYIYVITTIYYIIQ